MIELGRNYRTRDGREVRIYAVDGKGPASVVHGAVNAGDGWVPHSWYADGMYRHGSEGTDLIEVKPRIKRKVWVNVYECGFGDTHTSRESADDCAYNRIACVEIDIDVEEGHGL